MLVLSRKAGQSLWMDGKIEVFVLKVESGQVRLGIRAPDEVMVLRKELLEELENGNRRSAVPGEPPHTVVRELRRRLDPGGR